jgi:hypothetical protein
MLASGQLVNAAWMDSWRGDSLAVLKRNAEAKVAYQAALAAFREQKDAEGEAQQLKRLAELDRAVDLKVERDYLGEQAQQSRANRELKESAAMGERMLAIERACRLMIRRKSHSRWAGWPSFTKTLSNGEKQNHGGKKSCGGRQHDLAKRWLPSS